MLNDEAVVRRARGSRGTASTFVHDDIAGKTDDGLHQEADERNFLNDYIVINQSVWIIAVATTKGMALEVRW